MIPLTASIEEVPDEEELAPAPIPDKASKIFDTKEDIWDNYKPAVNDISTYLLHDADVLIEYQSNGSEMYHQKHIVQHSFDPGWNLKG